MNAVQSYLDSLDSNVTTIDLSNKGLTSLPDLSRFIHLKILYCYDNQITQLDHLTLPNLQTLGCGKNQITQLDHLNLPNLQILNCHDNQITQLDHLNLPNLQILDCSNNRITQLDHLNLSNLQILDCSNTQITQLDHLHLPNLQILYCEDNNLISNNLNYWKEVWFQQRKKKFEEKRASKIIRRQWLKYWEEPYKYIWIDGVTDYEGRWVGIPRSQERFMKDNGLVL
jgi:Leucine-rich repeat (LRR) protein